MARAALLLLLAADLGLSFMWVWTGGLAKIAIAGALRSGHHRPEVELLKLSLSVLYMFFFAWLGSVMRGGAYNPLTVLVAAFSGGVGGFVFTALGRIPVQVSECLPRVIGSAVGVMFITKTFPGLGHGPRLNVGIHHGALTEGILTFMIVMVSMGLKKKNPKSFFMKTWISSLSKLTLHFLGSNLTGGVMNPASAFGWAFARGDHITLEHLFVYWLAPIQATLLAVWAFKLFSKPMQSKGQEADDKKVKKE